MRQNVIKLVHRQAHKDFGGAYLWVKANGLILCLRLFDASAASEEDADFEDALFDLDQAEIRYYKYYFA